MKEWTRTCSNSYTVGARRGYHSLITSRKLRGSGPEASDLGCVSGFGT